MLFKKFLSKAFNTLSSLAISSIFLGSAVSNSVQAMGPDDTSRSITAHKKEDVTRISLSDSPLNLFDDAIMLSIILKTTEKKKKLPLAVTSKYFHNLSCDVSLDRVMTIKSQDELLEMLSSRNLSCQKNLEQGEISVEYLLPYPPRMTLSLGCSPLKSDLKSEDLKNFLKKYPSLTCLSLKDKCIEERGAEVLGEFLTGNSFIKHLNLNGNLFLDKPFSYITRALSQNTTLVSLSLRAGLTGNKFTDFSEAIIKHPTLNALTFNNSSCSAICSFLTHATSLTSLNTTIEQFDFTEKQDVNDMCTALAKNSSLRKFGLLSMTMKKAEYVKALEDALTKNSSLTFLDLSGTEMDTKEEKTITELCKKKNIHLKWIHEEKKEEPFQKYPYYPYPYGTLGYAWSEMCDPRY